MHWPRRPGRSAVASLYALTVAVIGSVAAIMAGDLAVKVLVPVILFVAGGYASIRYCRAGAWLCPQENTLLVRNAISTCRIPLNQIMAVRGNDSGVRIELADGERITAGVLTPRAGSGKQQRLNEAIAAIARAAEAARIAHPETEALISAAAPLRARRDLQRTAAGLAAGPAFLAASFAVPHASGFSTQLRWTGGGLTAFAIVVIASMLAKRNRKRHQR